MSKFYLVEHLTNEGNRVFTAVYNTTLQKRIRKGTVTGKCVKQKQLSYLLLEDFKDVLDYLQRCEERINKSDKSSSYACLITKIVYLKAALFFGDEFDTVCMRINNFEDKINETVKTKTAKTKTAKAKTTKTKTRKSK